MFTEGIFPIGDGLLDIDEERLKGLLVQDDINEIYEVEQTPFARGKFAAVRRAIHKNSGVHFAAKFLKRRRRAQSSDKEIKHEIAVLMLCEEADNIVKLNAVHESRSDTALLLELATGGELQTFLDNEECLNEAQARICMREVLKALQFLHNRSIAHLDLKPQNILLAGEHIEDGLKLCDFGISRVVAEGTNVREIVGTPDYVAPEVLQYEPLSLLTDIWSVGVLTYVLLSGFSPFGGETKQETFLNISQCALTFPEKLFAGVSAPAIDFIRRALRIKPSDRMTAAGCLEHIWLKDECSIERQMFKNISKTGAAATNGDDNDDDDDGVEDEDEEEEEQDESFEEDLVELLDEEEEEEVHVSMEENAINGHIMDSSDIESNEVVVVAPINTIQMSNGKLELTSNGGAKSSNIPLMSKSLTYSATNGTSNNASTKMNTITIPLSTNSVSTTNGTISSAQHHHQPPYAAAARRHSSDANKENAYVAVKKPNNLPTAPPPIAKKPTLTSKIGIAPSSTLATTTMSSTSSSSSSSSSNQVVSSITIPTVATVDKHSNNVAVSCIFPDAPTTPKVIRKAPATDNSPTSVKALVKKFQLEGSSSNASSRATSPAPSPTATATAAGIATIHLKESLQQHQQQQMHMSNGRNCCSATATQRRASTNTINGSNSRDIERTTTTTVTATSSSNGRKSTTSLPSDVAAIVHQTSSASTSSSTLSLKKSPPTTATTTTVALSNGSSYKTTCVLCLTCSDNSSNSTTANISSSNGCRHTLAGSKVAIVSHSNNNSNSSSNSSTTSINSNNSANSTAAAILLSNHKQLQHHHHHHVHHHVHHQKGGAGNNLSLDQGIIC